MLPGLGCEDVKMGSEFLCFFDGRGWRIEGDWWGIVTEKSLVEGDLQMCLQRS